MASNTLTVTDNRTGKSYAIPILNGAIRAMDHRQIRTARTTSACSPTTRPS